MSKLNEIEKEYARNIIKFFCDEFHTHTDAICLIQRQIEQRLLHQKLIRDFKIDIPVLDKSDIRDIRIDNILENKKFLHKKITVCIRYKDLTFEAIELEYGK